MMIVAGRSCYSLVQVGIAVVAVDMVMHCYRYLCHKLQCQLMYDCFTLF